MISLLDSAIWRKVIIAERTSLSFTPDALAKVNIIGPLKSCPSAKPEMSIFKFHQNSMQIYKYHYMYGETNS